MIEHDVDPNQPGDGDRLFAADGTSWRFVASSGAWFQDDYTGLIDLFHELQERRRNDNLAN